MRNEDKKILLLTGVYGPSWESAREEFFDELREHKPHDDAPWIVCGDFNATLDPQDQNNQQQNWRQVLRFASTVSDLNLMNLNLEGRRFTWSNQRESPTMVRLDRFLISSAWSLSFPNCLQKTLPNTSSYHCPLLYTATTNFKKSAFFRLENFWLTSTEFRKVVQDEWCRSPTASSAQQLHLKLTSLQGAITAWTKEKQIKIKHQIQTCRDFFEWIDNVEEIRQITLLEKWVKAVLKRRYTELAVKEEEMWKQRAKIKWEL